MWVLHIHRDLTAAPLFWGTVAIDTTTNTSINCTATFSCSHSKQPVNKRTRSVWKSARQAPLSAHLQQRRCSQMTLSLCLISEICSPTGRDAYCIWSCRKGGCRSRYKHNMDTRWTEEEDQTCQQELWLLSATVGSISARVLKCNRRIFPSRSFALTGG